MPFLEQVFKLNGVPTHTFVPSNEFDRLLVALRTPGRGIVLEGPSGAGKTTAITRALDLLPAEDCKRQVTWLSARRKADLGCLKQVEVFDGYHGLVVIDDFHQLNTLDQRNIADYLKLLADREDPSVKLVLVGINNAGARLVEVAPDLHARIEVIKLEVNDDERVRQLLELGEAALNITIADKDKIVETARGSFYIAQMLAHETCLNAKVLSSSYQHHFIRLSAELVKTRIYFRLRERFQEATKMFARGMKFQHAGRSPYLLLLKWLAESSDWSINLFQEMQNHPESRATVSQIIERGFLSRFLVNNNAVFGKLLHFDADNKVLTAEDPQFIFFLRETIWEELSLEAGFVPRQRHYPRDFAFSYAGSHRRVAEALADHLAEQFDVFFDKFEESRILAEDVKEYLRPIFKAESEFVVVILSKDYPTRLWTKFESSLFRERLKRGEVIPILLSDVPRSALSKVSKRCHIPFDLAAPFAEEIDRVGRILADKALWSLLNVDSSNSTEQQDNSATVSELRYPRSEG